MKVVLISTDEVFSGIGVRTLSACLMSAGFETAVVFLPIDTDNLPPPFWTELADLCRDAGLIGLSCMTHGVKKAKQVGMVLRKVVPAPILIGGIHASLVPEELLEDFDFVCHGEGEDLIVEVASRLKKGQPLNDVPGLWMKDGGAIIRNENQPLKKDLDEYPFPDYDLSHQYILEAERLVPMRPIATHVPDNFFVVLGSRGCPHHCTYCCNSRLKEDFKWRKHVRHYSIDYLIRHMAQLCAAFPQIKSFWIDDDTFFAKPLSAIEDFSRRYKREIGRPFLILISPGTYHEAKLKALIEAGMTRLIMGIQSGSDRVNHELYHRSVSIERTMAIVRSLHQFSSSMAPCYDFIGMNPFETEDDLLHTIRFMKAIPPPFYIFNNNLAFYPGTELHQRAVKEGWPVANRIQHSDVDIGFRILQQEPIPHKVFHFLLLKMAGAGNSVMVGSLPRFVISRPFLSFFSFLNNHFPWALNKVVSWVATFCLYCQFRKLVKKVVGPRLLPKLKLLHHRFMSMLAKPCLAGSKPA